jgi:hypothetical protein
MLNLFLLAQDMVVHVWTPASTNPPVHVPSDFTYPFPSSPLMLTTQSHSCEHVRLVEWHRPIKPYYVSCFVLEILNSRAGASCFLKASCLHVNLDFTQTKCLPPY